MAGSTLPTLGALFTTPAEAAGAGQPAPASNTPTFNDASSREYEITLRGAPDCSLAQYRRLRLAELPSGGTAEGFGPGGNDPLPWASYEWVPLDASGEGDPLEVDHLYLVFSGAPDGVSPEEYEDFYHEHMRENLLQESFTEGWRWRSTPVRAGSEGRAPGSHLALYRMERDWEFTQKAMAAHIGQLSESWPDWFGQIYFCSLEAMAIAPGNR